MRKLSFAVIAASLLAVAALAAQPAAAQQCPKGQTWDYQSQSCKKAP
jgi:hypothetical protein